MGLDEIISAQNCRAPAPNVPVGVTSICSANPWVLKTALRRAAQSAEILLIESTCNQVNQFGGYTGLTPAGFGAYIRGIAKENGFPLDKLILGGDHLGPNPWQNEVALNAMQKSLAMVQAYARAGFTKIHLDASMRLADDAPGALAPEIIAKRAAQLAEAAEHAAPDASLLRYVIGTEVPVAGGAVVGQAQAGLHITLPADVQQTIQITRSAFCRQGLEVAWERVAAVVVQPGVEFGDDFVLDYRPEKAVELASMIESEPRLVYEAHSTDYQTRESLWNLVRDHFAILKVGPGLTFALREAAFALALMENELFSADSRSNLISVLDEAMLRDPRHWQKYYLTGPEQALKRKFSLSDRIRYYWPDEQVQVALAKLLVNMSQAPLPLSLVSQYAPWFYERLRRGDKQTTPEALLMARVEYMLDDYGYACRG